MKKNGEYNCTWFFSCLIILSCVFGVFYSKIVYYSDAPLHTLVAQNILFRDVEGNMDGIPVLAYAYPLYHLSQKAIHLILQIDYNTAAALLLPISIMLSVCMYRKLILMIVEDTIVNKYFADVVSIGGVLFNVARCWLNDWRYYSAQCGANPFHNPTILFVRPFAIASFIYYIKWSGTYQEKRNHKYAILFCIFMLLSVIAKPSYAIVFLPAMGIYTLYYMLRNKSITFGIIAFAMVLPSLVLLVIQQMWGTSQTKLLDVSIKFGGFSQLDVPEIIAASIVTFPVVILLFRSKWMKKDSMFFISIIALIIGWLQMYLFDDGGTGNFSWGYDLAIQFSTVIVLAKTRETEEIVFNRKIINSVAYVVFAYQVWVGIEYLKKIYTTTLFWY